MIGSIFAVIRFEWKKSLTWPRMIWWGVLVAFPIFMIGLIRFSAVHSPPREFWAGFLFALFPMLVSMLGTLLWATPAISDELERRSWIYLAVRPHGGAIVLVGKYLAAVSWVIPPAIVGLSIAVPLAGTGDSWRLWWAISRLVCLACPTYAAVYLIIGTLMPRRAIVLGVAYSLIFELFVSVIPAMVNKLTAQYRLRALLVNWCEIPITSSAETGVLALIGDAPAWQHVTILLTLWPILVSVALLILRFSEFTSSADSDV